jgi:hypothetical protein
MAPRAPEQLFWRNLQGVPATAPGWDAYIQSLLDALSWSPPK